jgi:outer membrane receptor protein involved in Fe transport
MTKNLASILVAAGLLGGGVQVALEQDASAQSSTSGAVRGAIKDKATGEALIGATVVATSTVLQGEQVVITDESGLYFIDNLPPGTYTLTVFYNDAKFSRGNVLIQVGKQAVVNVPVDTSSGAGGETIVIQGNAPIVDQGSTKTGVSITKEYTENIPVGRTFGAVLGASSGSQTDAYGVSMQGSTSVESTYIVEGINTTDTAYGGISSNLPNEFVQETEVITGGYNAEFGRSTGGVINVVTKQGSNEFHGSVFGYFTPYEAEADPILREGTAISNQTDLDYAYDVGAEIGGPIIKDKLWFHAGVNPSSRKRKTTRTISSFNDANNDGEADVNEETGFIETTPLSSTELGLTDTTYFYTAKINGALSQNHQFQISAWGNPQTSTDLFAPTSAPTRQREDIDGGAYDASAKWTSKFLDGKTQVDAVAGFHRGYAKERPKDSDGSSQPLTFFNYVTGLADFTDYETVPTECNYREIDLDGDGVPDTEYNPCPLDTATYGVGGLGFYEQRTNDRLSGILSVTQRVKLAGYHTFKAGIEFEQTTYNSARGFTGGVQYRRSASGNMRRRTYLEFEEGGAVPCGIDANNDGMLDADCTEVDTLNVDTKNINYGAYLQDSWQILPNLTLNAGVRWEQQNGYTAEFLHGTIAPDSGEPIPDKAFQLNNQIAPRIGLIYDPTQEGRSKLFGHWGRFYETMPMDINVRAFGGEILHTQTATVGPSAAGTSTGCPILADSFALEDIETCFPADGEGVQYVDQGFLGGATEYVAPGTKGQYLDEFILGGEYELLPDFKMGIQYVNRRLPQVIEDMSADSANFYLIGNPGRDYSDLAEELEALAMSQGLAECTDDDETNDPTTCAQAFVNDARAFNLSRIKYFDKPSRDYDSIAITANKRFSKNALMIASYTYSREYGNFPGLYSTETGQLDPNLTSMYDLQDLMANRWGPMGLDRPHNIKLDGFYQFDLKELGLVVLGGSFRAESGLPVNTLGAHAVYGAREAYILPRGQVERVGPAWQADIHVSYGYKLSKTMKVEGFLDVFNVFNNQATTDVEEQYTAESINPIVGGDAEDLRHAKSLDNEGVTPLKFKNFGNETVHQAPLSLRLGARLTF